MVRDALSTLVTLITGDATLRTLTGWSASDPRFYFYHRADAVIDAARPAYMTYLMSANPESVGGVSPVVLSIVIWGEERTPVLNVCDRMRALLHKKSFTTGTGRKIRTRIVGEQDTYNETADFIGRQLQLRVAYLDP